MLCDKVIAPNSVNKAPAIWSYVTAANRTRRPSFRTTQTSVATIFSRGATGNLSR